MGSLIAVPSGSRRKVQPPGQLLKRAASNLSPVRFTVLAAAIALSHPALGSAQGNTASWLDEPKPESWNTSGAPIPAAPTHEVDSRCRDAARPVELDEDKRLRDLGWNLVGAYQGGWQTLVIRGTAGYDGMCRPRQFQDFVFVRGLFAGTLSPQPMDSRTDGALMRVSLVSSSQLIVEYARYAQSDPLCCPSRTTSVVFEIASDPPMVRPVSTSTSQLSLETDIFSVADGRWRWQMEKTRSYLQRAGFRSITTHRPAHDIQNNWYVVTK